MTLPKPIQKIRPQVFIAPYGPSCVGKTTVMKVIAERLPLVRISNDQLRISLRKHDQSESLLKKYSLFEKIAQALLRKKYSLILDANFASSSGHLGKAKKLVKKFKTKFYLIRVKAPKKFVINKLKTKKWLSLGKGGLLATRQEAIEHFLRSSKQYDYDSLMPMTFSAVDSSKPINRQVGKLVKKIKAESRFY